jgi:RND family efflux transporter MFP subunit
MTAVPETLVNPRASHNAAPVSRKRWLKPVLGLIALFGTGAAAFLLMRPQSASGKASVDMWVTVDMHSFDSAVTTTGTVRLRSGAEVRVGSQVSGIVKKLNVTVGSRIQKGEVIAEIDPRPLESRVEQMRTQVAMDQVAFEKAQRDQARGHQLAAAGVLPQQQIEDLDWQAKAALAKLEKSKSDLAAAEVDLSYAVIRSPISGTVASVSTQEGETVAASFAAPTFVTIIEDNALELVAMVDETDIANVRPGEEVRFTVEALPSEEMRAVVQRIDPVATIISGVVNYPVTASIRNGRSRLKPDMTGNISIRTEEHRALVVPNAAVQRAGEERFVYVQTGAQQVKRRVICGSTTSGFTEIKQGLEPGDRVRVQAPAAAQGKDERQ